MLVKDTSNASKYINHLCHNWNWHWLNDIISGAIKKKLYKKILQTLKNVITNMNVLKVLWFRYMWLKIKFIIMIWKFPCNQT